MDGIYRFYLDDTLVYEQKNALTVAGRSIVIKSLLGIIPSFANTIAYGIGDSANVLSASSALITNSTLKFETGRTKVIGSSLQIENNNDILVYSGTINDPFQSEIREVALYPSPVLDSSIGMNGSLIFDFDNVDSFIKFGTASGSQLVSTTTARIGSQLYSIPQTDGSTDYLQYSSTDGTLEYINRYTSQDTFRLAGLDNNITTASVNFIFYTDSSNYYTLTFTTPTASGYFISEVEKGNATIVGNPSWTDINFVRFWQNNSQTILLDGLRIDLGSYLIDTNYGMISRAVLAAPVKKPASIPLTIEYSLSLGFNYGVS